MQRISSVAPSEGSGGNFEGSVGGWVLCNGRAVILGSASALRVGSGSPDLQEELYEWRRSS